MLARTLTTIATVGVLASAASATTSATPAGGAPVPARRPHVAHSAASGHDGVTLTVVVTGARERGGSLGVALFASPDGFPDGKSPAAAQLHPHSAPADTFVFQNLAPGRYAVAVQHDVNSNGVVDRNLFGAPKEPWGVSNNVRPKLRAPRFDEAAFDLRGDLRIDVQVAR